MVDGTVRVPEIRSTVTGRGSPPGCDVQHPRHQFQGRPGQVHRDGHGPWCQCDHDVPRCALSLITPSSGYDDIMVPSESRASLSARAAAPRPGPGEPRTVTCGPVEAAPARPPPRLTPRTHRFDHDTQRPLRRLHNLKPVDLESQLHRRRDAGELPIFQGPALGPALPRLRAGAFKSQSSSA
jgi:hypothetical protein